MTPQNTFLDGEAECENNMTLRSFGQITPLQGDMLLLAGYGPSNEDGVRDLILQDSDEKTVEQIRCGAAALERATKRNLGFSLSAWHNFLSTDETFKKQYLWPRTWKSVSHAIIGRIKDPDRIRIEDLALSADLTDK